MSKILQIFFLSIISLSLIVWLFSSFSGWQKLAEKYKTEKSPPSTFIANQRGFFQSYSGKASTGRLGIGVSEKGLYLSVDFSFALGFPSLLIPWNEIAYKKIINSNFISKYFTLDLGNPKISSLELEFSTIEKIHEEYGKPIFFEQLEEPNL